jgi:hypothetical protein
VLVPFEVPFIIIEALANGSPLADFTVPIIVPFCAKEITLHKKRDNKRKVIFCIVLNFDE